MSPLSPSMQPSTVSLKDITQEGNIMASPNILTWHHYSMIRLSDNIQCHYSTWSLTSIIVSPNIITNFIWSIALLYETTQHRQSMQSLNHTTSGPHYTITQHHHSMALLNGLMIPPSKNTHRIITQHHHLASFDGIIKWCHLMASFSATQWH